MSPARIMPANSFGNTHSKKAESTRVTEHRPRRALKARGEEL
jgi:hypothetical protein